MRRSSLIAPSLASGTCQLAGRTWLAGARARRAGRRRHRLAARHPLAADAVHRLGRVGERQHGEGDGVGVDVERMQSATLANVSHASVVARVELGADGAAPDRRLLRRLQYLGAGEQPARRDAVVDERLVVAAAAELRVVVGLTDERVERLEDVLDGGRARRGSARRPGRCTTTDRRRRRRCSSSASRSCRS